MKVAMQGDSKFQSQVSCNIWLSKAASMQTSRYSSAHGVHGQSPMWACSMWVRESGFGFQMAIFWTAPAVADNVKHFFGDTSKSCKVLCPAVGLDGVAKVVQGLGDWPHLSFTMDVHVWKYMRSGKNVLVIASRKHTLQWKLDDTILGNTNTVLDDTNFW